jgi:hypothetical protein
MKYPVLWMLFLLLPIVLGQGIGITPSVLHFEGLEERQLLVFNQQPYPITYEIIAQHVIIDEPQGVIPAFSKKMLMLELESESKEEELITFMFLSPENSGVGLHPSLSVKVNRDDSERELVKESTIKSILDNVIFKRVRNFGPVISFVVFVAGLIGYLRFRG